MKVCLLVSGKLGFQVLRSIAISRICFVFTNSHSTDIIDYCSQNGIHLYNGNPRKSRAESIINSINCELILSVNYLYIINENLIRRANYAINIHGSLLPRYRGRTPHVWAIINGENETGVTAHLLTKGLDEGPILVQKKVEITSLDTGASILRKFEPKYLEIVQSIIKQVETNTLNPRTQDHSKASYFNKRTPNDGKLLLHWQRERVYNWIRAQAHPYPGAFFYYNENKVNVHSSSFSDLGFNQNQPNGMILKVDANRIYVKFQNGVLSLSDLNSSHLVEFVVNTCIN